MKEKNYKKTSIGKKLRISCIIPIRINSKRIKNKNFRKINKVPLVKFVLNNIQNSKYIDEFYLASEKFNRVKKIINKKKNINFFLRSKKSSSGSAKTEVVIDEFLKKKETDIIVLVQATNPFIKSLYLDGAIKKMINQKFDSVLSVVKSKHFIWSNNKYPSPINYNIENRKMSQSLRGHYVENGSFYIFYKKNFLKTNNRLHGKIGAFEMPKESIFEIDDFDDLKIIRKLLS